MCTNVAFRVRDEEYGLGWTVYSSCASPSSGSVDRFHFRSLYTRELNGILYEIATGGPRFAVAFASCRDLSG